MSGSSKRRPWPCELGHFGPLSTVTLAALSLYTLLSDLTRCYEVLLMLRVNVVIAEHIIDRS